MINKIVRSVSDAIADIKNGATVFIGGFGDAGNPVELVEALANSKVRNLKVISNNAGTGQEGLSRLFTEGLVEKITCSYPIVPGAVGFKEALERGEVELELVPQGTLVERIRAGGAGLGGVLTPTGVGTEFETGMTKLTILGKEYLIATPLRADFALIKAWEADRWGNLIFRHAARNFNAVMATAATVTIVQAENIVAEGLSPDSVHTPGIFVDRVVEVRDSFKEKKTE